MKGDCMKLIDADALFNWGEHKLKDATKYGNKDAEQQHWSYSTAMMYEIADEIDDAPAIDAAPVAHGKWVPVANGRGGNECTDCHEYAPSFQNGIEHLTNYCPNCGAKMDAEV
jgi:hypothetical protein